MVASRGSYRQDWRGLDPTLPGLSTLAREGEAGRSWYAVAGASVRAYAAEVGADPSFVAGVLAVTSPRVHVRWNAIYADHYIRTGTEHPRLMASVRAALRHYVATGEIRGPKTRAFRDALLGDPDAVVVDVWTGRALGALDEGRLEGKRYDAAADRIRRAAKRLRWTPAETQAAIWTGARARFGHKPVDLLLPRSGTGGESTILESLD